MFRKKAINILSVDGGGIRGIVPALILAELERILKNRNKNKYLYELFHMMAGTSIGGIICLGLSTPKQGIETKDGRIPPATTAHELVDFYREKGRMIFPVGGSELSKTLKQTFSTKYDGRAVEAALKEMFGDTTLKDSMTNVLITSYDTENREPRFFKSIPSKTDKSYRNFYVRDVARATAAAPTFFPPAYICSVPYCGGHYSLIDGGVYCGNPALCAYIEAFKRYPRAKGYRIFSLGTGIVDKPYPYNEVKSWGYKDWMSAGKGMPLFDMMMDGQRDTVTHMLEHLSNVEHYRFDFHLDGDYTFMDDAREQTLRYFENKAKEVIEYNKEKLERFCKLLCR